MSDLQRFVDAQKTIYAQALKEISGGRKTSHWMWFVFPQLAGLGSSPMSQRFAIQSLAEAQEYLNHPVLGPRLVECAEALLRVHGKSARELFGSPDDLKLRSSMTLFARAAGAGSVFGSVLRRYFAEGPDARTVELLTA